MLNWIIKFITAAVLSHALFLWVGPHIVMSKLDKNLKRAQTEYRPECGERWVEGVFYVNPAGIVNQPENQIQILFIRSYLMTSKKEI